MDREELYEAARSEAFDLIDLSHTTDQKDLVEAFVQGAEWLMNQPLSKRLTETEKESIVFGYNAAISLIAATTNPYMAEIFKSQQALLVSIFGKELFEPKPKEK